MRRALAALSLAGLVIASPDARQALPAAAPESIGLDPRVLAEATALLERFVAEGRVAGAVAAVARHGKVGYLQAVGVQDLATRTPMTERSLFRIYSMTKAITATAALMVRDTGRYRLDDPVSRYLPDFADLQVVEPSGAAPRKPARPVTVQDLFLHTSGLSHRTSDLYRALGVRSRADTLPEFVRKITRAPLMEDPGTRFRYSEASTVLGRLIEVWTSEPFERFLQRTLLTPLGMTDTVFWVDATRRDRLASVYGPSPSGGLAPVDIEAVPFTVQPALIEGAVGLVSSVPDFLRFQLMLLAEGRAWNDVRLVRPNTVAEMTANGLTADILKARGGRMGWGLANVNVLMEPDPTGAHTGEYGWDGTAGTIFWNDPATNTAIVLMTQSVPANPDNLRQTFKAIVQRAIR